MKKILYTFLSIGMFLFSSCLGDLDQAPVIETTSAQVYEKAENYKAVLAKLYASYVIAGQDKGGGNPDIVSNNNFDYLRCYFNMQEAGTDELASTWLSGDNVRGLTYLSWDANDSWVSDMYYRIYYTIALCNEFLRYSSDGYIARFTDSEQAEIRNYRSETRFLRTLAYYHAMDLYKNVPFVSEKDPVGAFIPPRYEAQETFTYIESELKDIENSLPTPQTCEYGRASQAAAWTLLAKLYLNSKTYTNKEYTTECVEYCQKVIAAGFSLEPKYDKLFNADNQKRTNEIIFSFNVDAQHTVSWGSTTYIICGAIGNDNTQNPTDYGITSGWGMFRTRGELPALFEDAPGATDSRAMFFSEGQSLDMTAIDNQKCGYFVEKWTNLTDAREAASNTGADGASTDYPMFRLADVYLMLAEAVVRGGTGATKENALFYVNELRKRAYGNESGNISSNQLTLSFLLSERARELYWEATRRTDLIRYNLFTTADYLWQWKGGVKEGKAVDSKYNYYPIPTSELSANPNLHNDNY